MTSANQANTAYIAFGANLGDPSITLARAIPLLIEHQLGHLQACSSLYETRALTLDGTPQPNYLNAVFAFETHLSPPAALDILLRVEKLLGRQRESEPRWAPRSIDLDLLFIGGHTHKDETLTLPHPELHKRDFVLVPMSEIAASFSHPLLGQTMHQLENTLESRGFSRFVIGKRDKQLLSQRDCRETSARG
jgi:2-amino-4-hydroxy-6-hydroxymethyldihydropteridine diphosphokinase